MQTKTAYNSVVGFELRQVPDVLRSDLLYSCSMDAEDRKKEVVRRLSTLSDDRKNRGNKMRGINTIIFLFCSIIIAGQDQVWDQWDPRLLEKANTAADIEYYNDEEKKVVFFMNLARLDGNLFAETLLDAYVTANGIKNSSYLRSLYRDLRKVEGLPLLIPEADLTSIAQGHASESGRIGHVGHKGFEKRFEPYMGAPYTNVGENCSYGYANAIDIVITLLIDEGVKNVGHRVNILKPEFNSVGVAIRPHKRYRFNCVIDFGKQDRSNLNEIPF